MRPLTLRNSLVLIVAAALVPIGVASVALALSSLRYSRTLISNQLVISALATAGRESNPLILGKQVLLTNSTNELVRAGGAGCHDALTSGLGNSPALLNLAIADAVGQVKCSVLPFNPGTSFAGEAWWQRGIKARGFTVSGVVHGPITKKPIIIGMLPITAADGTIGGTISVAIDVSWLARSLEVSEMSRNAAVAIIDGDGKVVLTTETRILPRFDVNAGSKKVADAITLDGVAWMYAVAPLYNRELYVVYAEPTKQLMRTVIKQVRMNLILPIFALAIATLALWFSTNYFVLRWLIALRKLASQFAQGTFAGDPARFAKAPREIGLLSADLHSMARAIEARDHDLMAALKAKTALTHDIHHRVKNNLQIVSSLLNLQSGKISDPAARDALSQTRARIGALAQIHRLLYEESHDSDHGAVNIAKLLDALCSQLRTLHRGQSAVHLSCDVATQIVPINSAVPLTLFAVEAVTNAFRHGFPGGRSGSVLVHFDVTGDQATLSVSDDGVGYDPSAEIKSMGLQLMEAFAQQLDGEKTVVSTPAGTTVTLRYTFVPPSVEDIGAMTA